MKFFFKFWQFLAREAANLNPLIFKNLYCVIIFAEFVDGSAMMMFAFWCWMLMSEALLCPSLSLSPEWRCSHVNLYNVFIVVLSFYVHPSVWAMEMRRGTSGRGWWPLGRTLAQRVFLYFARARIFCMQYGFFTILNINFLSHLLSIDYCFKWHIFFSTWLAFYVTQNYVTRYSEQHSRKIFWKKLV